MKKSRFIFVILSVCFLTLELLSFQNFNDSSEELSLRPDSVSIDELSRKNEALRILRLKNEIDLEVLRPFAEYEKVQYVFLSAETYFESQTAKVELIRFLPEGVSAVVYSKRQENLDLFRSYLDSQNIQTPVYYLKLESEGVDFWARDVLPFPVYRDKNGKTELAVVDSKYFHKAEPDQWIADWLNVELISHSYFFEGGNLISNHVGDCIVVNSESTKAIPDNLFYHHFGCQSLLRLRHVSGIGHIDEKLKFISEKQVLTSLASYIKPLQKAGFRVAYLPEFNIFSKRSYANALLVNGVAFVPQYFTSTDQEAKKIYEQFGYRVVFLDSRRLSDYGKGSIHCIAITYPETSLRQLGLLR